MKNPTIRSLFSVILGLVVAFAIFMVIELIGSIVYPFPEDFSGTPEEIMAQVENYPTLILVLLGGVGWALSMLLSVYAATRLGTNRHPGHGAAVGAFWFGMLVFNMYMLPYPTWYWVLNLVLLPVMAFVGIRLGMNQIANNEATT